MAQRTIIIKPAHVAEMIEVFGERYQAQLPGPYIPGEAIKMIPNPETKVKFAGRIFDASIAQHIQQIVMDYRRRKQLESIVQEEIIERPTTTTTAAPTTPTTTTV